MDCSTCFPTTSYQWLVELADCDEAAMVAEYGEVACTVCFPDAPTFKGFGDGTSAIARYSAAEKAERAAERQARADAKAAKTLDSPVSIPDGYGRTTTVETVHGAKAEIKSIIDYTSYGYGEDNPRWTPSKAAAIRLLVSALAAKGIDVEPNIAKWVKAATKAYPANAERVTELLAAVGITEQ